MLKFVLLCSGSAVNIRYQQPKSNTVILVLRLSCGPDATCPPLQCQSIT